MAALFGAMVCAQGCGPSGEVVDAGASDARGDAGDARDAHDASPDVDESVFAVEITPATAAAVVGGTATFTATARLRSGRTRDVSSEVRWGSSDASVATIDAGGVATAQRRGRAMITATLGAVASNAAAFQVVCEGLPRIALTPDALMLTVGDPAPHPIEAHGMLCDGSSIRVNDDMGIMWSSNDTSVATVDARGQVFAGSTPGSAIITVRLGTVLGSAIVQVAAAR